MRRIVIKNKFRFILFLLVLFMIFSAINYSFLNIGRVYSKSNIEYTTYIVDNGETLWDIAKKNNPQKKDIRKVIYEIQKYNNISSTLSIGQEIKIPV